MQLRLLLLLSCNYAPLLRLSKINKILPIQNEIHWPSAHAM